jgi:hypothetical protein
MSGYKLAFKQKRDDRELSNSYCTLDCGIANCEYCYQDWLSQKNFCGSCSQNFMLLNNECVQIQTCQDREIWNGQNCQKIDDCCEKAHYSPIKQQIECVWPKEGYTVDGKSSCYVSPSKAFGACPSFMFNYPGQK